MQIVVDCPEKGIIRLMLDRAEKRNALDGKVVSDWLVVLDEVARNDSNRLLLITGAGKDFCAGADLAWMQKMALASEADNYQDATQLATLFRTIHAMPIPVLALVQGATFGGGMGVIAACDMVLAAEDATFCFPETRMGLAPSVVSPWIVPLIGERAACYYFLTGEKFSAEKAEKMGLVQQVVPTHALQEAGITLARKIIQNSPHAIMETRKLLQHLGQTKLSDEVLQMTANHLAMMRRSPDAKEGLQAYFEKRKPAWEN